MGLTDSLVGAVTKKLGVSDDQAKGALDQILPFVQGKLGGLSLPSLPGLPGGGGQVGLTSKISHVDLAHPDTHAHGEQLLSHIDPDEQERHVQQVAKATGLAPDLVRRMFPTAAAALHADGALDKK